VKTRVSVSISDHLVQEIDARRGLAKRSNYVEHLMMKGLEAIADEEQSRLK